MLSTLGHDSSHSYHASQLAKHLLFLIHAPAFHPHSESSLVLSPSWGWGLEGHFHPIHFLLRSPVTGTGAAGVRQGCASPNFCTVYSFTRTLTTILSRYFLNTFCRKYAIFEQCIYSSLPFPFQFIFLVIWGETNMYTSLFLAIILKRVGIIILDEEIETQTGHVTCSWSHV